MLKRTYRKVVPPPQGRGRPQVKASAPYSLGSGLGGYDLGGAEYTSWDAQYSTVDQATLPDLYQLRAYSQSLHRTDAVAFGAIENIVENSVGGGLKLRATPDYEKLGMSYEEAALWTRDVEKRFESWATSRFCDHQNTNDFYDLQSLILTSYLLSGDVFCLLKNSKQTLQIHIIEANDVGSYLDYHTNHRSGAAGGVEVDKQGRPIAYYVNDIPYKERLFYVSNFNARFKRVLKYGRLSKRLKVVHMFKQTRPQQRRGVPLFSPVLKNLKQLNRYTHAELMGAIYQSRIASVVESGETTIQKSGFNPREGIIENNAGGNNTDYNSFAGGTTLVLGPGERYVNPLATKPNSGFDTFFSSQIKQIGMATQIPYEVLLQHFASSYSASRASLMKAWDTYNKHRKVLIRNFLAPVYQEWLYSEVVAGRIKANGFLSGNEKYYSNHSWVGKVQQSIDPSKDIQASILAIDSGLKSRSRITEEVFGFNWTEEAEKIKKERELLEDIRIEKQEESENEGDDEDKDETRGRDNERE